MWLLESCWLMSFRGGPRKGNRGLPRLRKPMENEARKLANNRVYFKFSEPLVRD